MRSSWLMFRLFTEWNQFYEIQKHLVNTAAMLMHVPDERKIIQTVLSEPSFGMWHANNRIHHSQIYGATIYTQSRPCINYAFEWFWIKEHFEHTHTRDCEQMSQRHFSRRHVSCVWSVSVTGREIWKIETEFNGNHTWIEIDEEMNTRPAHI